MVSVMVQQSFWSGITIGFIYGLIALGFALIYNVSKILNIAQGELVMAGALMLYSFVSVFHTPIWLAFILVILVAGAVGAVLVKGAIEPLKKPEPLTYIIATIAFSEIIRGTALLIWGTDNFAIPSFIKSTAIPIFSASVDSQSLLVIGVSLLIYFAFSWVNKHTNFGISLNAISGDPYAAQLMGINVKAMTIIVFIIGSGMAAIGGILIGPLTTMSYYQGTMLGIKGFIAGMIGGIGSYKGAILGGLVLGLFESFAAGFLSSLFKDAFALLLLFIVLVFLPNGLGDLKKVFKVSHSN
ncbi:branched-chain amino acid ABC transporter permease [Neobacillus sp. NPDC097160]|uniref:branched-chain amino acid ABC transporter permease n=1 Tax=Neobacillus sp. NPDC097160 TaxID=3364298 RepID=UPI0037FD17A1